MRNNFQYKGYTLIQNGSVVVARKGAETLYQSIDLAPSEAVKEAQQAVDKAISEHVDRMLAWLRNSDIFVPVEKVQLVDEKGKWMGFYRGPFYDLDQLIEMRLDFQAEGCFGPIKICPQEDGFNIIERLC